VGGLLSARLGRRKEALDHLRAYLDAEPNARDVDRIRSLVRRLSTDGDVMPDISSDLVGDS